MDKRTVDLGWLIRVWDVGTSDYLSSPHSKHYSLDYYEDKDIYKIHLLEGPYVYTVSCRDCTLGMFLNIQRTKCVIYICQGYVKDAKDQGALNLDNFT